MQYIISTKKQAVTSQEAIKLWIALGWGKHKDYNGRQVSQALCATTFIISARNKEGKLIGLARVLSDGIIHTLVADIAVHPDWRRQGIGEAMMKKIKERYGRTGIYLDALKENKIFFTKCGYKKRNNMIVFSRRFVFKNKSPKTALST